MVPGRCSELAAWPVRTVLRRTRRRLPSCTRKSANSRSSGIFFSQKVWCMSGAARLALVDRADGALSIVAQCRMLRVARSTLYWRPAPVSAEDLDLMHRLDVQYLATPFYGTRRMAAVLRRAGLSINRK